MAKRPVYEVVVIVVVVVLALVLGTSLYAGRSKVVKSGLLIQELSMLRSGVALYKMTNGKNPKSLDDLAKSTYRVDYVERPFIDRLPATKDGQTVDPFGKAYAYDSKTGWVHTTSKNYNRW